MCEQCHAETDTYLNPIPGWALVRATRDGLEMKTGQWGLVRCNDPDYIWDATPWCEPDEGDNKELEELWDEDWMEFDNALKSSPEVGYVLVEACKKVGYKYPEDGAIAAWLFNHLGKYIATRKPFKNDEYDINVITKLEQYGYLEPEENVERYPGKIYQIVSPHTSFSESAVAFIETGNDTEENSYDLEFGYNVLLVKMIDDNFAKVLYGKNQYKIHRLFLSKNPIDKVKKENDCTSQNR